MTATDRFSLSSTVEWMISRDIFPGLQPKDLIAIVRVMKPIKLVDGEVLVRRNDPGESLFVIVDGMLKVTLDEHSGDVLVVRKAGEIIGEMSILTSTPRSATLIAEGATTVLSLSKNKFEKLALDAPETVLKIAKILVGRLQVAMTSLQVAHDEKIAKEREAAELRVQYERDRREKLEAQITLDALRQESERKQKELEQARQLQLSLLPDIMPESPLFKLAVHHQTATEVGGDYYDFFPCRDGSFNIIVGDATGHGMQAGMVVTVTKALACASAHKPYDTRRFMNISNAIEKMDMRGYYMALTTLNVAPEKLSFVSASMPPFFRYVAATGAVEEHVISGLPLGVWPDAEYEMVNLPRCSGDVFLILSDGLNERFNPDNEMLGLEAVKDTFARFAPTGDPTLVRDELLTLSNTWAGGADIPPNDDVTFVVIVMK